MAVHDPHDLSRKLEALEEYKSPTTNADRWGAIKDWLESHDVPAPERLPTAPEIKLRD
ncbi:MAG: hypothetical protein AAF665_19640 [Pseudomonadota bacterium]